jgi:hypothetical protein
MACNFQESHDKPLRIESAWGDFYAVSGMTWSWTQLQVKVANRAFRKKVVLHYRASASVWLDRELDFVSHHGNYDVFGSGGAYPYCSEFVIRYTVNGEEYWDNNYGTNYHIGSFRGLVGGNVALRSATAKQGTESGGGMTVTTSWFEGEIFVQNLSYHKDVGVLFSADGGISWENASAEYAGPATSVASGTNIECVERWTFKTPTYNLDESAIQFLFAVFYEIRDLGPDHGIRFWDNNFTQNYHLDKTDGAQIN